MTLIDFFKRQFVEEGATTRKMLALVKEDDLGYQPHPKSMSLKTLAVHLADLPGWVRMTLTTRELDVVSAPPPVPIGTADDLRRYFEQRYEEGLSVLTPENEAQLDTSWTLRNGDTVYLNGTKVDVLRWSLSQQIHHRAQLGVYLRLLDIPIPGSYGPSADDPSF